MERLDELIKDKVIAYVAPTDDGLAADVSSYELVARAGTFCEVPGQKTDIVLHSFNSIELKKARENVEFFKTLKFVIQSMIASDELPGIAAWLNTLNEMGVPAGRQDDEWIRKSICEETATTPNAGMIGLQILLNTPVKEIHMYGFNFYNWGKYGKVYTDQHYLNATNAGVFAASSGNIMTPETGRADLHNQGAQIRWFKELLKREPRIIIDKQMREGLNNYEA